MGLSDIVNIEWSGAAHATAAEKVDALFRAVAGRLCQLDPNPAEEGPPAGVVTPGLLRSEVRRILDFAELYGENVERLRANADGAILYFERDLRRRVNRCNCEGD